MDTFALENIDLNEKEITIYLVLLKVGKLSGGKIAERISTHRRTVYDALSSLVEKGLVTYVIYNKIKYFSAVDPKRIVDIVDERSSAVKRMLPKLEALQKKSIEDAKVEIYQGIKSIKHIFEEILTYKSYSVLGSGKPLRELLGPFFLLFQKEKKIKKISSKIIISEMYSTDDVSTKSFGEIRFIKDYDPPTTTYIYGSKVAIIISEPPLAILIDNNHVNSSFKLYFDKIWDNIV
ncbi:helix-turn-helix domain-containing protein [Candidatus Woesearchaeota archaeon]|nr:helix-turn-helix domain-containing protein [Candidatus Woesearchaeota archaeon]